MARRPAKRILGTRLLSDLLSRTRIVEHATVTILSCPVPLQVSLPVITTKFHVCWQLATQPVLVESTRLAWYTACLHSGNVYSPHRCTTGPWLHLAMFVPSLLGARNRYCIRYTARTMGGLICVAIETSLQDPREWKGLMPRGHEPKRLRHMLSIDHHCDIAPFR